jgi:hypothetical protein
MTAEQAEHANQARTAESVEQSEQVERFEVTRAITAPATRIFDLLCDPNGHVAIDSSGMLQSADGEAVRAAGTRSSCTWTARR